MVNVLCCNILAGANSCVCNHFLKMDSMANPNPSPATRFGAGKKANPIGKTSEMRSRELSNADKALKIREKLLDAIGEKLDNMMPGQASEEMSLTLMKMLKDAEDRGLGAPVQAITNPDGALGPRLDTSKLSTEAMREILKAADDTQSD